MLCASGCFLSSSLFSRIHRNLLEEIYVIHIVMAAIPPSTLRADAPSLFPSSKVVVDDLSTKRCCCCLEHKPRSVYSNAQWNSRHVRPRARRKMEQQKELNEQLAACIATFDQNGEPLSWRKCIQCMAQTKCLRGPRGWETKNSLKPNWSFLD